MNLDLSQRISITIDPDTIAKLDKLADYLKASRSGIVRLAILRYVREPANEIITDPPKWFAFCMTWKLVVLNQTKATRL